MSSETVTKSMRQWYQREKQGTNVVKIGTYESRTDVFVNWAPALYQYDTVTGTTHPGPPYREGGPVSILHQKGTDIFGASSIGSHWVGPQQGTYYDGHHWVSGGSSLPGKPVWGPWDGTSLDALGATGWKKFQPGKPTADMGVFFGEGRELPRLFRDSIKALKDLVTHPSSKVRNMSWLANQHLCTQFGWLPLLRDLQKAYDTFKNLDKTLKRLRDYNGRWERRGGTISKDQEQRTSDVPGGVIPAPSAYATPPEGIQKTRIVETVGTKIWFRGCFKYYIADFESPATQLRLKARIFGLTQTPLIVWNLLPWSWLVDWFTNLGDNIENLCPIDGLVAKYAYVMRHNYYRIEYFASQRYKTSTGSYTTFSASNTKWYETKERQAASPFGFGLTNDDLSLRQWSILAALGIQRFFR